MSPTLVSPCGQQRPSLHIPLQHFPSHSTSRNRPFHYPAYLVANSEIGRLFDLFRLSNDYLNGSNSPDSQWIGQAIH